MGTAAACCAIVLCVCQIAAYRRAEIYEGDSSTYLVLAQNLADGQGYVFDFRPQTRFPPGFPGLLAAASTVVGREYTGLIRLIPLCGVLGLLGCFVLIGREEGWAIGALACVWLASSPDYFRLSTRYLWSDLPYFCISTAALLVATRLGERESRPRTAVRIAVLSSAVIAAVMLRSAGIALVGGLLATVAWTWRTAPRRLRVGYGLAAAAGLVAQTGWMLWSRAHAVPEYPGAYMHSYLAQLTMANPLQPEIGRAGLDDFAARIGHFAAAQMTRFTQLLVPVPWLDVLWFSPLVIVPGLLLLAGIVISLRRRRSMLLAWYVVAYLGLYSLWPFDEGTRFTVPIFPLLFLFAWRGLAFVVDYAQVHRDAVRRLAPALAVAAAASLSGYLMHDTRGRQGLAAVTCWLGAFAAAWLAPRLATSLVGRYGKRAAAAAAVLAIAAGFAAQVPLAAANVSAGPPAASIALAQAADWLRSRPAGDIVMARHSAILHRLTRRRVVGLPVTSDGHFIAGVMRSHGVNYIVMVPEPYEYFTPTQRTRIESLLASEPQCCQLVMRSEAFDIYQVVR